MTQPRRRTPPPVPPRIHPARLASYKLAGGNINNTSQSRQQHQQQPAYYSNQYNPRKQQHPQPHRLSIPISLLLHQPSSPLTGQQTPSASPSPPSNSAEPRARSTSISSSTSATVDTYISHYTIKSPIARSPAISTTSISLSEARRPISSGHLSIYHAPPSPVSSVAYSSCASSPPYSVFSGSGSPPPFSLGGGAYLSPADRTRLALKKQARRYQARKKHTRKKEAMAAAAASEQAARKFFAAKHFAVVGASQDTAKYGYKLLAWYAAHNLPVTPVNPRSPLITLTTIGGQPALQAVPSPSALSAPRDTSLSIVTPPAVTRKVLREAREAGVRAVWLQPGSFDDECLEFARSQFDAGIGGQEERVGGEGWCVLVHGEAAMRGREKM